MKETKNACQTCRGCCKFRESDRYFAPLFSQNEVDRIRESGFSADCFKPHKNHADVFQIVLTPSLDDASWHVCPFLNEETHLCAIYEIRPTDCRIWPLMMMRDKDPKSMTLGCFNKDFCEITDRLSSHEFTQHVTNLTNWFDEQGFVRHYQKTPGLAWDFEPETFHIRTLEMETSALRGLATS
jgi:uncharacterized protein